ncbi:hypothetical protein ADL28_31140 [Streptomyces violaceusniger]|uniref:Uncharacterized protein n=1 Tax=Streptomyces violaceusniger TaxID=68280 RepID=A0A0X3VST1_STRVO|nr:hypothetical protein ADL28_31140 [Streptomyces violaceusniger]
MVSGLCIASKFIADRTEVDQCGCFTEHVADLFCNFQGVSETGDRLIVSASILVCLAKVAISPVLGEFVAKVLSSGEAELVDGDPLCGMVNLR